MPLHRFKVLDSSGAQQEVSIDAQSRDSALGRLRSQQMTYLAYLGEGQKGKARFSSSKGIKLEDFTENLSSLLKAGVTLERSLEIIEESLENEHGRAFVGHLRQGLHEGQKFSVLVGDRPEFFPKIYTHLVMVGEESGTLSAVLERLHIYLQEKKETRSYVISASVYPLIVGFISLSVLVFMLAFIVPQFAQTFAKAKTEPSGLAAILFDVAFFLKDNFAMLGVSTLLALAAFIYFLKSENLKEIKDQLFLKIPFLRKFIVTAELSTFFRTLGIMIGNGVHMLKAVQISEKVINNSQIRQDFSQLPAQLRQGKSLSSALSSIDYISGTTGKMFTVGEETGKIDEMVERVAEAYEKSLKQTIKNFLSAFEPLVMIFLGGSVGFIVITMFLAISDLTNLA